MENKNTDEIKINKDNDIMEADNSASVDPMTFMTPEQAEDDNKKAEVFFKAFRFGTPGFFNKIKEVYEIEGIKGLERLEMSLDTYMTIRNMVITELMASNQIVAEAPSEESESAVE